MPLLNSEDNMGEKLLLTKKVICSRLSISKSSLDRYMQGKNIEIPFPRPNVGRNWWTVDIVSKWLVELQAAQIANGRINVQS